jgi:hypothetical protein
MPLIFDAVRRLEANPTLSDLGRGFRAEVADPAWLLGRQWQLGEHMGEDASSPVRVSYRANLTAIDPVGGDPNQDPRTTPAEAIVESEPGDFWTPGRRVLAGRTVTLAADAAGTPISPDPSLLLEGLPTPYDVLDGTGMDGRVLWERRADLSLDEGWFGALRPPDPEPTDVWDPAEFSYSTTFEAGGATLRLERHDGGDLDWYSVDADDPVPSPSSPAAPSVVFPSRVRFPGAPLPRWWQIEDAAVDVGGYPPDRSHLATTLLVDLIVNQSDDWFSFAVDASAGHVVTLEDVVVTDSFGDTWTIDPPGDGWSLFATEGLSRRSLVVWSRTGTPLSGQVLDEVTLGIDEDANLVWAVEQRLRGRHVATDEDLPPEPPAVLDASGRPGFAYRPATRVPRHWHPYVVEAVNGRRRFVQGRAADLSGPTAQLLPAAESDLLVDAAAGGTHPVHQVEPAAIPPDGVRVERRAMLARRTDGSPVLWRQRRRQPLLSPPALRLRFDALESIPPSA